MKELLTMSKWLLASVLCVSLTGGLTAQTPVELKVGDKAPDFSLPGTDGKTHTLAEYKGKTVVLAWYPAAFTGGCTAECRSIRDASDTISKYDVAYFMASVDTPEKNKAFAEQEQANFPMLSDPSHTTAMAYGVVTGPTGVAKRWTFFIGPDGKILHVETVNHTADAGTFLASKLAELKVKTKK
jgi:thioredoxin-dependent peroxiredoxin